jgi:hypothetical protein
VLWREVLDDVILLAERDSEPVALARGAPLWRRLVEASTERELEEATPTPVGTGALTALLEDLYRRGAVERQPDGRR